VSTVALSTAADVKAALADQANASKAAFFPRFFKAGPGQYAEGDQFLGVTVPAQRAVARRARGLPREHVLELLQSPIHEHRLTALLVLVWQFEHAANDDGRAELCGFYLEHRARVNNWDLVDSSAPHILGAWLLTQSATSARRKLMGLADSPVLWDRRIAMLATQAFIKAGRLQLPVQMATRLVDDPHDLMHKAVGWMLREVGEHDVDAVRTFLTAHAASMPRTMLRTAIEKLDATERRRWLDVPRM
jgi:3-methyladenine DNA glycosylase AlkD